MRRLIWGAVCGAMVLAGCATGSTVVTDDNVNGGGPLAQNPKSFERGATLRGTVTDDYSDMLVLRDKWGGTQYLRISNNTRYFDENGKQMGRASLGPGSSVRASFENWDKQLVARDITVVHDTSTNTVEPAQLEDRSTALPP